MARGFTFAAGPLPVHWRMLHRPVSLFRYSRHLLNAAVALLMVLRSSVAMELLASASESLSAGADWET